MSTRRTDEDFSAESPGPPRSGDRAPRRGRHDPGRRARRGAALVRQRRPRSRSGSTKRTAGCGSSRWSRTCATAGAASARVPRSSSTTVLTLAVGLEPPDRRLHHLQRLRAAAVRRPRSGQPSIASVAAHDDGGSQFRWRDYEALRERRDLFEAVVAEDTRFVASEGRTLSADFVSDNYFETLAPRLLLGRGARRRRRARAGGRAEPRRRGRGSSPAIPPSSAVTIDLDGRTFTIVGVLRAGVHRPRRLSDATCGSRCPPTPSWSGPTSARGEPAAAHRESPCASAPA